MAQLESRDGVRCDLCHMVLKTKFQYYSCDLNPVQVFRGMAPSTLKANRSNRLLSLDLCGNCYNKFASRIIDANAKLQSHKRRGKADCELTGQPIPDGPAILVFITLIDVNLETKNVTTDANHLSFLICTDLKSEFEPKPLPPSAGSWETSTK